jgi:hypothetical protein
MGLTGKGYGRGRRIDNGWRLRLSSTTRTTGG